MSAKPVVTLYTAPTPNGFKVAVFLEELRNTYGFSYEVQPVNVAKEEQKEPWFIAINPNGRIPAIVDRSRNDFVVFETAAILIYLQQHYDTENKFGWDTKDNADEYSEMLQWIFFAHGGVGPMQGQLNHFRNAASEVVPYALNRQFRISSYVRPSHASLMPVADVGYLNEVKRLYGVLDIRLGQDRDYLAGPGRGMYSIADMNVLPWLRIREYSGLENLDEWPNVKRWCDNTLTRDAWEVAGNVGRAGDTASLYRVGDPALEDVSDS
ncbi:glutathione S-transferase C-terminal-like protein [Lentinula aciculospora]|uniref:Glutathione S-transferase C-terminal-like protein n=1 Tax=Lentinula aciculospora TaxID=153920 RepID=A0A9W9A1N0_9AGAR|nr:glutathione S-transferase C-terminal-like protein [Lentinula aciculospora]KAJ4471434.1 glutathione S-transferase C-terminal-like protein [Lentinula aciculospora]